MTQRNVIKAWLQAKHTTIWQTYNLTDPVQLEKAIDFVCDLEDGLAKVSQETDQADKLTKRITGGNPPHRPTRYDWLSTPIRAQS